MATRQGPSRNGPSRVDHLLAQGGRSLPGWVQPDGGPALAQVTTQVQAETVAAMASAAVGIGMQFTSRLGLGNGTACIVQGSRGCVSAQRVGDRGVLVLFGGDGLNMARLNLAVRQALPRVHKVLDAMGV